MKLTCEIGVRSPDEIVVVEGSKPTKIPVFLAGRLSKRWAAQVVAGQSAVAVRW